MIQNQNGVDENPVISKLKHYLPSQAPLKDFIHHNTLHAFQNLTFHKALLRASTHFGYKVYFPINTYRQLLKEDKISISVLNELVLKRKGSKSEQWLQKILHKEYDSIIVPEIGRLRREWKSKFKINMDKDVHPILFRLIGSYLDQGIAVSPFPESDETFIQALRNLDQYSYRGIFKSIRVRQMLQNDSFNIEKLLDLVVGNKALYERYIFDQQFAHPGWSGMVSYLEDNNHSLYNRRKITLRDFIVIELLFEIDALDNHFGENWKPIGHNCSVDFKPLFEDHGENELFEVLSFWQEAYEWTYYNKVIQGLTDVTQNKIPTNDRPSFQAMFCIDDRAAAFRAHLESAAPNCKTFGTAGFFNAAFYFEPEFGKFYTKVCPAPLSPTILIKEKEAKKRHKKDAHFNKHPQGFILGWLASQTIGFWSVIKLTLNVFYPTESKASVSSFKHMDANGKLKIEYNESRQSLESLQMGFNLNEMATNAEQLLRSIGLINNFSEIVYIVGHGASSTNNTHYAGYDCGACSGRPGSVNARVSAYFCNHPKVRLILAERGITLSSDTIFIGGLHDTTKDEIEFYDLHKLNKIQLEKHKKYQQQFETALMHNAKERAQWFMMIDDSHTPERVHKKVKLRALSLFEPRPEWNHATNALCVVGRRETQLHFNFERRAFLNSYDYQLDPNGDYLLGILNAVAPVCGGINLEYYFSKMDNQRLGAGTKLPHNVMGLIGVANGMDGDLRPGLPMQMVNIHDPIRLLTIVEHYPDVVLSTIQKNKNTFEWFQNSWIHLVVIHPENKQAFRFEQGEFHVHNVKYAPNPKNMLKVA